MKTKNLKFYNPKEGSKSISIIQRHLNNLDQGFIYLTEEDELNDIKTQIFNFRSTPAETILSKLSNSSLDK